MNDVPFHITVMGRRFYEAQLPKLIAAIERLSDQMERIGSGIGGATPTISPQSPTTPKSVAAATQPLNASP